MSDERRTTKRHAVFAGNAEITDVFGRGRSTKERARVVNWSRGGVLLKVHSPRRKMIFVKNDPVLFESDGVECTLRLAPAYKDIDVKGEVCHVAPIKKDPDHLLVGIKFDTETTRAQNLTELAQILEPRSRSGRHKRISSSHKLVSARLSRQSGSSKRAGSSKRKRVSSGSNKRDSGSNARVSGRLSSSSKRERFQIDED